MGSEISGFRLTISSLIYSSFVFHFFFLARDSQTTLKRTIALPLAKHHCILPNDV